MVTWSIRTLLPSGVRSIRVKPLTFKVTHVLFIESYHVVSFSELNNWRTRYMFPGVVEYYHNYYKAKSTISHSLNLLWFYLWGFDQKNVELWFTQDFLRFLNCTLQNFNKLLKIYFLIFNISMTMMTMMTMVYSRKFDLYVDSKGICDYTCSI